MSWLQLGALYHLSFVLFHLAFPILFGWKHARMSGEEKKRLALQLLTELLREQGLRPPLLLLDVVLEAAVRLLKPKTESNRQ